MFDALTITTMAILALSWYYILGISIIGIFFLSALFNECVELSLGALILLLGIMQYNNIIHIETWNLLGITVNLIIYLIVGLAWSFFKYRRKTIEILNDTDTKTKTKQDLINIVKRNISKSMIVYWIIFFPISILKFLTQDLVDWIVEQFHGVYNYIARYTVESHIK